jgi:hypothetical protein
MYHPAKRLVLPLQIAGLILLFLYYGLLLTDLHLNLLHPATFGLTFNSMLDHLLRGEFNVDPDAVRVEGFLRDGRVFAYWGIFCALLRLPLLAFPDWRTIDVTTLSCLVAVCLNASVKLATAVLIYRRSPPSLSRDVFFALLVLHLLLASAQIGFLRASIYQEVVSWSALFSSIFIYGAIRGLILERFTPRLLAAMAVAAGLALLTRVSTGIGLYAALGFLAVTLVVSDLTATGRRESARDLLALTLRVRIILPLAILLGFAIIAGVVNYFRWGNAATFADFRFYILNQLNPARMDPVRSYGLFNIARIPIALSYYFFPVWALRGADGGPIFAAPQARLFDVIELPPGSFLLSDLLPILFLLVLCGRGRWRMTGVSRTLAIAAGVSIPGFLMLTAVALTYRYRMEFYPALDLAGFLGLYALSGGAVAPATLRRLRPWAIGAAILDIAVAHGMLVLYKLAQFGPSAEVIRSGLVRFYADALARKFGY